jgi:signal transduction histidine kinase
VAVAANPWLAIDAATPPAAHARAVRRDWEHFVSDGATNGTRAPVADSWRRSRAAGIDPSGGRSAPPAADRGETSARWESHPLADAAPLIRDRLASVADATGHLIVVSDADGVLLQLEGDARVRSMAADSMNFTEGALWSESAAGTNAVGTAVAADHAVQVFAAEHFVEVVQAWTCSAAPVHDPDTGELLGVIDLTGLLRDVHPDSLAVTVAAARAVETQLRDRLRERDDRLRARYEWRIAGGADRRALVAATGRLVADDARGWLHGRRLEVPPGGGELVLPTGGLAVAEPLVGPEEAFVVREISGPRAPRHPARDELRMLADEQAVLRRLAVAVAHAVPPGDLFAAVAREAGQLLGADATHVMRHEAEDMLCAVASWSRSGDHLRVGTRIPRAMDLRSSACAPIVVAGRPWGVMIASSRRERRLPPDTESRIGAFAELVAAAIAGAEARAEAGRLAEEQAALRRVATLVARDVPASELFGAVAAEVGRLLGVDLAAVIRHEAADTVLSVGTWCAPGRPAGPAGRWPLGWTGVPGSISSVASPIVVEGRPWGFIVVHSRQTEPLARDTESRLENFTELVATAISNIEARADLAASRARLVAAADEERSRVTRDLHDGAQQRLVHTIITLKLARQALGEADEPAGDFVAEALEHAQRATAELRELARGILPTDLTRGGLRSAVEALASRMALPVDNDVSVGRLGAELEATAYFIVAEALTNVAKHSRARHAAVTARLEDGVLHVEVRDDGVGGARPDGSGLVGLGDRVAVLDGALRVESPPRGGTVIAADIPLRSAA